MADTELQKTLLESERTYRPQYNELNLADYNTYLRGTGNQMGMIGLSELATRAQSQQNADAQSFQRQADINDVSRLGSQASEAFMLANPALAAQMQRATALSVDQNIQNVGRGALGDQLYSQAQASTGLGATGQALDARAQEFAKSTGKLTPQEMRDLEQGVRGSYASRGRAMDNSAIGAESYSRLANQRQRMMEDLGMSQNLNQGNQNELNSNRGFAQGIQQNDLSRMFNNQQLQSAGLAQDRGYGLQLAAMQQGIASDPFMAILGRPSSAPGMGQAASQFASGLAGSQQGPQLFDPNAGINLALKDSANTANYNSAIFGAQAGLAGAQSQAKGAMYGGLMSGLGALGSGISGGAGAAGGFGKLFGR